VSSAGARTSGSGGLEVVGLHKSFGPQAVLAGVDLVVPDGSFTAILGPSGSGKTTLLRLVAGFDRPDSGRISLGDRVVDGDGRHVPSERRRIGYVPQEGGLFPHLTVEANIRFGLSRAERRRSVGDLVDLVGLGDLTQRYPHQLSGGQQQRVALARALAIRPELVLLDEPFSSLDAALRASVRDDVRRVLAEAGTTALLVTHDQDEALSLADQLAVLRSGRIVQGGSPAELYARPVDPDLARFVGDGNLCQGVVSDGDVLTPLGRLPLAEGVDASLLGSSEVLVLVRPEQVVVDPRPGGGGLVGRVAQTDFHGHDTVISVVVAGSSVPMQARLAGGDPLPPGTEVTLSAAGSVMAWPAGAAASAEVGPPIPMAPELERTGPGAGRTSS
jgi:iron(III) transport system ATP-binding protein